MRSTKMDERIPAYLAQRLISAYGDIVAEDIAAGYVRKPSTLRANTLKTTADQVAAALAEAGIAAERVPWYGDAFILPGAQEKALPAPPLGLCHGDIACGLRLSRCQVSHFLLRVFF